MAKLKNPLEYETAFGNYTLDRIIGEGGAGRVYGGVDANGTGIALKMLTHTSSDKRKRFKNEIGFLMRNRHPRIVTVSDYGLADGAPFYVMPLYSGSLRDALSAANDEGRLRLFGQILDGVEAAHLSGVIHRDLKPENVLVDTTGNIAIADFGVARFTEEELHTLVRTGEGQRLANFMYAAPEQREHRGQVTATADIYALGLMLNEMFTGKVPHGTDYEPIGATHSEFAFLDAIVAAMIRQAPSARPATIAAVKTAIMKYRDEAITLQRLSAIDATVIPVGEIDEPLAHEPPRLIGADWQNGRLALTLDRPVSPRWVQALHNMGNFTSILGAEPRRFGFQGDVATIGATEGAAQQIVDNFKNWLPEATNTLRRELEAEARQQEHQRRQELQNERNAAEARLRVNSSLRI